MRQNMVLREDVGYLSHSIPMRHLHAVDMMAAAAENDHWRRVNRLPPYDVPVPGPRVVLVPQIYNEAPKKATKSVGTGEDPRVLALTKQLEDINKKLAQI